jgi:hypothetical protein
LCNDQKAKYNQGACAKPDEQYRSVVALWVSYALDVATDLAGIYSFQQMSCLIYLTGANSDVSPISADMEYLFAQDTKVWHIHAVW